MVFFVKWFITFSSSCIFLFLLSWETTGVQTNFPQKSGLKTPLEKIIDGLMDGPIQVQPLKRQKPMLSQEEAINTARNYTGFMENPRQAWAVLITDREFIGGLLQEKPCWLLEYQIAYPQIHLSLSGFVVIDGQTPVLLEAFTLPLKPWWRRLPIRNEKYLERLGGEKAFPVKKPPNFSLSKIIAKLVSEDTPLGYYEQIIIRHYLCTRFNEGIGIHRIEGAETTPGIFNVPAWFIYLEGIHRLDSRAMVMLKSRKKMFEEEYIIGYDAQTGEHSLGTRSIRFQDEEP